MNGEDFNDGVMPAPRATPSAAAGGCSRISSGHVGPEVDKDRNSDGDFDILIKNMRLEHLSTLPENVAARKRWKSGYWHKWYKDLDLSDVVDDLHDHANCEILVAENEEFENDDVDDNFNWIPEQEASEPDTDDPLWSVVGSPPFTEDARRELPALHDHDQQGGNSEAKPFLMGAPSWSEELPEQWYLPEVLQRAREKFEYFYGLEAGSSTGKMIDTRSSLTVAGWADAEILNYADVAAERRARTIQERSPTASCWSFGSPDRADTHTGEANEQAAEHNETVAKLIGALGESGAGRRAILRAVAERQGIVDADEVEDLLHGRGEQRLQVPPGLREALHSVGLGHALAPVNILTATEGSSILINNDAWEDLEFEVALDSGSVVHVCAPADCPGYSLEESPGSKRGQEFQMGDGGCIPNLGQMKLNLSDKVINSDVQSIFQIAAVTRPLMSVGKICDEGHTVTFSDVLAVVHNKQGEEICKFHRNPGGLYVAKLKLRSPAGFGRPE